MIFENRFIAFFDLLGFSSFIKNNDNYEIEYRIDHLFRDIEYALGKDALNKETNGSITYDISNAEINCLTISDSVIFWTDSASIENLHNLIEVSYLFNQRMANWNFPLRGALVYGQLGIKKWDAPNNNNKVYRANSIYGKGLIKAYEIANSLEWCGTVIDNSIFQDQNQKFGLLSFLSEFSIEYNVPVKSGIQNYLSFYLEKPGFSNELLENKMKHFEEFIFKGDNKTFDQAAKYKLDNTNKFLKYLQTCKNK